MQSLKYRIQNDPRQAFNPEPVPPSRAANTPSNELFMNQGQGIPLSESAQKLLRQVYEQQLMQMIQQQQQGMQHHSLSRTISK